MRAALRYHGGKWLFARKLIPLFPKHKIYVEPFGGAASVLLQKPRVYGEVYNDLDSEIVNFFRVLRDPLTAMRLQELLRLTPFARDEFRAAYEPSADSVEQARRTVVRSFQGFGSASVNRDHRTGFRSNSNRSGTTPAKDWANWPNAVTALTERMRGVVIENKHFAELIPQHDTPETLFYVDPPYPFSTRSMPRGAISPFCYRHEMTDDDHRSLAAVLHSVKGFVVLSGYDCDLYAEMYAGWTRRTFDHFADGAKPRTETVWLSPRVRPRDAMLFETRP